MTLGLRDASREIQKLKSAHPPFLAMTHFSWEWGGGVYFEGPRGRTFIRPPLFCTPPTPIEGHFQGRGVSVMQVQTLF